MYSETVYVRMSKEETTAIDELAEIEGRSRSSMIREIIRRHLNGFNFTVHQIITLTKGESD